MPLSIAINCTVWYNYSVGDNKKTTVFREVQWFLFLCVKKRSFYGFCPFYVGIIVNILEFNFALIVA